MALAAGGCLPGHAGHVHFIMETGMEVCAAQGGGPGLLFVILNHRSPFPPHLGRPQELDGNVVSSSGAGQGWPGPACPGRWPSPALGAVELTEGLVGGGPSWADRARPELIGVSACVRVFPPVGVSRLGSPGTWRGAWSLGLAYP